MPTLLVKHRHISYSKDQGSSISSESLEMKGKKNVVQQHLYDYCIVYPKNSIYWCSDLHSKSKISGKIFLVYAGFNLGSAGGSPI